MTDQEVHSLLEKFKSGTCTPEEHALILSWYNKVEADSTLPEDQPDFDLVQGRIWANALAAAQEEKQRIRPKKNSYWRLAAAAAILILLSSSLYYYIQHIGLNTPNAALASGSHDIPPGSNKATLTLANGKRIQLVQAVYTVISIEHSDAESSSARALKPVAYNTITTPNGGQYEVILPDGSKVYLNAASSLKYPTRFEKNERKVTLTGEGYFEITKNPKKPFIVLSSNQTIKVLGTHFNVSTYAGEPAKTTLVEGSVLVSLSNGPHTEHKPDLNSGSVTPSKTLKPGEQSTATANSLAVAKVNPNSVTAWKDGLFVFTNTNLKDMLKQIARWYDVDVDYTSLPTVSFYGEIPRNESLLKVLKLIEAGSNVSLKLEGRRITLKK